MGEPVQRLQLPDEESGYEGEATCLKPQSYLMAESPYPRHVCGGGTS